MHIKKSRSIRKRGRGNRKNTPNIQLIRDF